MLPAVTPTGDTIETYEVTIPAPADDEDADETEIDVSTFEYVTGSMHDDSLTGDHRDNHLMGGGGDDSLRGGAGMDLLIGGPGADMLDGGEDEDEKDNMVPNPDTNNAEAVRWVTMIPCRFCLIDWAVYKGAAEAVMVDLSTNMGTGGEAMGDTLRNIELVWGSEKGDTFIASNGADIHRRRRRQRYRVLRGLGTGRCTVDLSLDDGAAQDGGYHR